VLCTPTAFNTIGPKIDYLPSENDGSPRVFSHFMNGLLYGTPMKLVNGGTNMRGYTYISDAIDAIVRIVRNPLGNCDQQILNVGNPDNELTIKELAEMMCDMFDKEFRLPCDPPRPKIVSVSGIEFYGEGYEDCDRRIADVSKARSLLGWEPSIDMEETVRRTMSYFVDKHRAASDRKV